MTAPRSCRRCGAALPTDVRWCTRCFEPVRNLTPRERQLPPRTDLEPVDPATLRRDYASIRLEKPVYSRVRRGPTTLGLWGRMALTAFVLFWLPWGRFGYATVLYLLSYVPIAGLLLAGIWRREVVGPASTAALVHEPRAIARIRAVSGATGLALVALAIASSAAFLGYLPAVSFLAAAAFPRAAEMVEEAIAEARDHPLGTLIALNGLNVLDLVLSDAVVGAGVARELNPLVMAIGPWAKLTLVAACSALLWWRRPRALVWPSLAFLVLAAYHLTALLGGLAFAS